MRISRSATWKARASDAAGVDDARHEALARAGGGRCASRTRRAERPQLSRCCHRTGEDRETARKRQPVTTFGVADDSKIPKGRIRRSAKLGSIVGVQGARYAGTKATNVGRSEEGEQRAARAAPPGDGDEDGRRARPDEGRGDEAGPVRLLHRHRVHPRRVPRDLPGAAGEAAHRRAGDALGEGREGARRGVRRRAALRALRRDRDRGLRRRLDRPGAPGRAARRPPGRGQDPVPGDRRGARRRPAQRRHDRAAGARAGARPRREGDRRRDPRAGDGGARLRVRGAEPALLRPRLPRPPLHLRAGSGHPALAAARPRHRARRGPRLRGRSRSCRTRSAAASARSSSAAASARSTTCSTSTPTPTPATTC